MDGLEGFPLSPQQKRLWQTASARGEKALETRLVIQIDGPVEESKLTAALNATVARHEILRTHYARVPGMTLPVQVVTENKTVWVKVSTPFSEADETAGQKILEAAKETPGAPLDLEKGPVVRAQFFVPADSNSKRRWLLLRAPSLSIDEASLLQWFSEIVQAYAGRASDGEIMQYADYSAWQTELLESPDLKPGRDHWRKSAAASSSLPLPFRIEQPNATPAAEKRSKFYRWNFRGESFRRWKAWTGSDGGDGQLFWLGLWHLLTSYLSNSPNLSMAAAVDGRKFAELKNAMGLYGRYVPVLAPAVEAETFRAYLDRLAKATANAAELQECFSWDEWPDQVKGSPLRVGFRAEKMAAVETAGECRFELISREATLEDLEICLAVQETPQGLDFAIEYATGQFSAGDIQALAERFNLWVEQFLAKPDAPLQEFEWITKSEKELLLGKFAGLPVNVPRSDSIHSLIEAQAVRTPEKPAVICGANQISYRELNEQANQLAHRLIENGVGPEKTVATCFERSIEAIVAILATLKAGGAYVPLDPSYPPERLQYAVDEIKASWLLTHRSILEKLPETQTPVLCLENEAGILKEKSLTNPAVKASPKQLAYVIFTSGSTGKPKGVQIEHQNLVHSTLARHEYYRDPVSSYLLVSSFAFDSSVAGIFWTLTTGGALVLPKETAHQDPLELVALIERHKISHFLSLPSLYALLLEQASPGQLDSLRTVIVAGEACPPALVEKHRQKISRARLHNEYGPTEATVWSTATELTSQKGPRVTIGRSIPNASVYLLDSRRKLAPIGSVGELYIGGAGVARGYANRPELTTEKFLTNPFSSGRVYQTGDLGRFTRDGEIEFLGRVDHQVKIRGYRIELGEIENVLRELGGIREAVVTARERGSDSSNPLGAQKQLVAYLVAGGSKIPTGELRATLKAKLPEFMIPSAFVWLESIPLSPNGKVDRARLPAPGEESEQSEVDYVAARTPVEEKVVSIWTDVLKRERIGVNDNFFEMGGHSLMAIQVMSRLRETFQLDLPLRVLFESPTVALLSERVGKAVNAPAENDDVNRLLAEMVGEMSDEEVRKLGSPQK